MLQKEHNNIRDPQHANLKRDILAIINYLLKGSSNTGWCIAQSGCDNKGRLPSNLITLQQVSSSSRLKLINDPKNTSTLADMLSGSFLKL